MELNLSKGKHTYTLVRDGETEDHRTVGLDRRGGTGPSELADQVLS